MSTAVRSKIPSSYSSKSSSQVLSANRQPEILLKSLPERSNKRAAARRNRQRPLPQSRRNAHQASKQATSDQSLRQANSYGDAAQTQTQIASQNLEPTWLKLLVTIQRSSTPITFLLGIAVLIVYGWSVYSQRAWSSAYSQLAQSQREERQLTADSEARKFQLAQQAGSSTVGLVHRDPANVIFLKPEPTRNLHPNSTQPIKGPAPNSSVGY